MRLDITGTYNPLPNAVALTDLTNNKVFQRDIGGTSRDISVSGTYTGGSPGTVQGRVLLAADSSVVVDWTAIDAAPSGGAWTGSITVPQGGPYKLAVRSSRATGVGSTGTNTWCVGIVFIGYGQSNFLNFMGATPPDLTGSAGTYVYSTLRGWITADTDASQGSEKVGGAGIRALLNFVTADTGVPCGIIYGGQSGVNIEALQPPSTYFSDLTASISAGGGDAECIIWHQGEGNTVSPGVTPASYVSQISTMHSNIVALLNGRTKATCPFVIGGLARNNTGTPTDDDWYEMNQTLVRCQEDLSNVYYSHSMYDADISVDNLHISGASWELGGRRYAQTVAKILGTESVQAAWFPASAARVDATHTDVTLTHSMGTDFTPTSGITGFRVTGDNGANWLTPSAAVRQSATVVRLTHSSIGTVERTVQYQYGAYPDISGMVKDNSSIQVPLGLTKFYDLVASGASALPVPHLRHISQQNRTDALTSTTFDLVEIGPASADRFLIIPIIKATATASVTSVLVRVTGQSDISLSLTSPSPGTSGHHTFAYGAVGAAYGKTATIVINYSVNNFATPVFAVYDVSLSSLSSTTPSVSLAVDTDTDVSVSLATSAGGFNIATAFQSSAATGGVIAGSVDTYAERMDIAFSSSRRLIADCMNTAAATNSTTVTFSTTGTCSLAVVHWR